ncbi:unnamed protein product [Pseudo-nitzschia multistriata]|uniref:JmjC domain-containing protein n=1 Tax=Pseudo-nitzschia multistriata TaxID=183589 RepID=A0A448ZB63_9STRA|nr:unnamed protein product [Pseudo-nitzschia multistriata]
MAEGKKKASLKRPKRVRLQDFTCIEDPHPYGCLPGGNRFFGTPSSSSPKSTDVSKRKAEDVFDDKVWQQIISFCDGCSFGRLVQSSRYLYVVGHQPELWRDQVLRKCDAEKLVISRVGPSWKDTYVRMFHDKNHRNNNSDNNSSKNETETDGASAYRPHRPMRMPNVYSDDIYRSHLCRSFAIPPAWLKSQDASTEGTQQHWHREVDNIAVDDLNAETFFANYEEKNQPVVVSGAANGSAVEKWKEWDYLTSKNTKDSYRSTSGAAPLPGNFSLEAYRDYTVSTRYLEESPLYLFDRTAFASNREWGDDFFPDFYEKCPYWDPSGEFGHDMLQYLGEKERPDHTWVIMGPKRSGSVFHIDPNATHAWNACIRGRKRWIFYPPGQPPPGVFPSADGDEVALPLSVGEWIIQYWKEHTEQYRKRPVDQRPMECTTHPGDVVFVPHGWWHSVVNLDDSNIAITHNYVSPSNLGNALKFFVEKQDQISGCRDRKESIKPEYIHGELVKALAIKEPDHLNRAMKQTGWTCRAWEETPKSDETVITDDDEHSSSSNKNRNKRKIDSVQGGNEQGTNKAEELPTSVMSKTEKVPAFSFSFL